MPLCNHSAVQREAGSVLPLEASPVKQTQSLVNKGPLQLLSIETLSKIATEPPPIHPPLLFRTMGICVAMVFCRHGYKQLRKCTGSGEGRRRREGRCDERYLRKLNLCMVEIQL